MSTFTDLTRFAFSDEEPGRECHNFVGTAMEDRQNGGPVLRCTKCGKTDNSCPPPIYEKCLAT